MLPYDTIQQAFQQAHQASLQLRALVLGKHRPSAEGVKSCMEAGAQISWMTSQGKHSSNETAVSLCLARGYHEALDMILDYTGKVAPPKGGSFFQVALGSSRNPVSAIEFGHAVQSLVCHGYDFNDNPSGRVLAEAMDRDLPDHAQVLIDAGALRACDDPGIAAAVLGAAMGMPGGLDKVLAAATPAQRKCFADIWWECAKSCPTESDLPSIVHHGLGMVQPTPDEQDYLAANRPGLFCAMIKGGLKVASMAPLNEWEDRPEEPFWRRNAHAMLGLLGEDVDPSGFMLSTPSPRDGSNWLVHMVLENSLVQKPPYSHEDVSIKLRTALPKLLAGGLDLASVNHRGYTAGWYILLDLIENKHSRANIEAWLELVKDFQLYAPPVMVGGEPVPFVEAHDGQMGAFLQKHGLLEDAQAAALEQSSPAAPARRTARRI